MVVQHIPVGGLVEWVSMDEFEHKRCTNDEMASLPPDRGHMVATTAAPWARSVTEGSMMATGAPWAVRMPGR